MARITSRFGSVLLLAALLIGGSTLIGNGATALPRGVDTSQPNRVLDTRAGIGAPTGRLNPGKVMTLALPAAAAAGATSVVLNLTATDATAPGWVKSWPCGEAMPATSSINFVPGRTSANMVSLKLAPGGICLSSYAPVHVVADLSGWFTGSADLTGSTPNRLLDTRQSGAVLRAGVERRIKVAGTAGIDASATFAALNFTVDQPGRPGWLVAYPCGQPTNGSTVNFTTGEVVANLTFVGLTGGDVCLKSFVDVQVVIDSYGWANGSGALHVQSPQRLLDTRDTATWQFGATEAGGKVLLRVAGRGGIPNDADAALITITVADTGGDGFVTTWPCDQPMPPTSTINTWPNQLRSNLAMVKLAADGTACLQLYTSNSTSAGLIVDGVGYTTGGPSRAAASGIGSYVAPPRPPSSGGGSAGGGGGGSAGANRVNVGHIPGSSASEPTGNFRTICSFSHFAADDPVMYPGQPGASHLHMFFGNTGTNAYSTYASLRSSGSGSCQGGILNRSGYWAPAVFNAAGKALTPDFITVYYKGNGPTAQQIASIRPFPEGMKMIAGYNMANPGAPDGGFNWVCESTQNPSNTIPNCPAGERIGARVAFPPCWDGVNLDSSDHRSHMAYGTYGGSGQWHCPAGYPVLLPEYSIGIWFANDGNSQNWYLSSDRMPGMTHANGSTFHADWFGAWDPTIMQTFVSRCIDGLLNCIDGELGDGTKLT